MIRYLTKLSTICFALVAFSVSNEARADLILDQVIVDLEAGKPLRGDIEITNAGDERIYVLVEPFEILNPGLDEQVRTPLESPSKSRILVSPTRAILEPGERRLVRIAALGERPEADRIFRVRIRPVVGDVISNKDALKVLVGYDTLVLLRASEVKGDIESERDDEMLTLTNRSNTAFELFEGRQCDSKNASCEELPAKRLYPSQTMKVPLKYNTPVTYKLAVGSKVFERTY